MTKIDYKQVAFIKWKRHNVGSATTYDHIPRETRKMILRKYGRYAREFLDDLRRQERTNGKG